MAWQQIDTLHWPIKGAGVNDDKHNSDVRSMARLSNGTSDDGQEMTPAPFMWATLLPRLPSLISTSFYALGDGVLEEVCVQRYQWFDFVRYSTHEEAAMGIQIGNTNMLYGKAIKCSWGSKLKLLILGPVAKLFPRLPDFMMDEPYILIIVCSGYYYSS